MGSTRSPGELPAAVDLLEAASALRWDRPDLTAALAEHVRDVAENAEDRDRWLAASGWLVHARAATGDGRPAACDALAAADRWGPAVLALPQAARLQVELAGVAITAGDVAAARALIGAIADHDDTSLALRADAAVVALRCDIEDGAESVEVTTQRAETAWRRVGGSASGLGVASVALIQAAAQRRAGRPRDAVERSAAGLARLERIRGSASGGTPSAHLAAALAAEWISALVEAGRHAEARHGCRPLLARLAAPSRPSRQLARLRLAVARAVAGHGDLADPVEAIERAARDATACDVPDLEALCCSALGAVHEQAGRVEVAVDAMRIAVDARQRDEGRTERLGQLLVNWTLRGAATVGAESAASVPTDGRPHTGVVPAAPRQDDELDRRTSPQVTSATDASVDRWRAGPGGAPAGDAWLAAAWGSADDGDHHSDDHRDINGGRAFVRSRDGSPSIDRDGDQDVDRSRDGGRSIDRDRDGSRDRDRSQDVDRNGDSSRDRDRHRDINQDSEYRGTERGRNGNRAGTERSSNGRIGGSGSSSGVDRDSVEASTASSADHLQHAEWGLDWGAGDSPIGERLLRGLRRLSDAAAEHDAAAGQDAAARHDTAERHGTTSERETDAERHTATRSAPERRPDVAAGSESAPGPGTAAIPAVGSVVDTSDRPDVGVADPWATGAWSVAARTPVDRPATSAPAIPPASPLHEPGPTHGSGVSRERSVTRERGVARGPGMTRELSPTRELGLTRGLSPGLEWSHERGPESWPDLSPGRESRDRAEPSGVPDDTPRALPMAGRGCVVAVDLARDTRRFAGRRAADVVNAVADRLIDRLPGGARLRRDEGGDVLSVVLQGWSASDATRWMQRTLPTLLEGLRAPDMPGVALRAAVHDADGPIGAQILQHLDGGRRARPDDHVALRDVPGASDRNPSDRNPSDRNPSDRNPSGSLGNGMDGGPVEAADQGPRSRFPGSDRPSTRRGRHGDDGSTYRIDVRPGSGGRRRRAEDVAAARPDGVDGDTGRPSTDHPRPGAHPIAGHDAATDHPRPGAHPIADRETVTAPPSDGRAPGSRGVDRHAPDRRLDQHDAVPDSPPAAAGADRPTDQPADQASGRLRDPDGLGLADLLAGALAAYRGI